MNMNYKEKFEEFLSKMQRLIDNAKKQGHVIVRVEDLENAFPELKESEDERIRRALVEHIKGIYKGSCTEEMRKERDMFLAWLEKQDSHYTFEIKKGHWYKCVCDYMLNNSDLIFKNNRLYYCRSDWRLGGEIDERNVKDIGVNGYKSFFRPATNQEIKDWLEKQGEQKTDDKVEPKFKAGDWIVFNGLILHIDEIINGYYRTTSIGGIHNSYDWDIDNVARCWSIQDAKDGDVLVHSSSMFDDFIFIYNNTSILQAYCYYSNKRNRFIIEDKGHHCPWNMQEVTPATKEQCDLLFQKMKKAGYTFDFEKKELKKIEQLADKIEPKFKIGDKIQYLKGCGTIMTIKKIENGEYIFDNKMGHTTIESGNKWYLVNSVEQNHAWSEEDKKMLNNIIYIVKYKHCIVGVPNEEIIAWLKSLKERVQPQQEWSEEDEQYLLVCKNALAKYQTTDKWDAEIISHWLENKLKAPQSHWKPSTFHLECVEDAIAMYKERGINSIGLKDILEELKKLREE